MNKEALEFAKPQIPKSKPIRRDIPDVPDPMPKRIPESVPIPVRTPRLPVPVR